MKREVGSVEGGGGGGDEMACTRLRVGAIIVERGIGNAQTRRVMVVLILDSNPNTPQFWNFLDNLVNLVSYKQD